MPVCGRSVSHTKGAQSVGLGIKITDGGDVVIPASKHQRHEPPAVIVVIAPVVRLGPMMKT